MQESASCLFKQISIIINIKIYQLQMGFDGYVGVHPSVEAVSSSCYSVITSFCIQWKNLDVPIFFLLQLHLNTCWKQWPTPCHILSKTYHFRAIALIGHLIPLKWQQFYYYLIDQFLFKGLKEVCVIGRVGVVGGWGRGFDFFQIDWKLLAKII